MLSILEGKWYHLAMSLNSKIVVASVCVVVGVGWYFLDRFSKVEPTTSLPVGDLVMTNIIVDQVDVLIMESYPVQIITEIKGRLPDPCSNMEQPEVRREGNDFFIDIVVTKPSDSVCEQTQQAIFEEGVLLDVTNLKKGNYTVSVGGKKAEFTLDLDNLVVE